MTAFLAIVRHERRLWVNGSGSFRFPGFGDGGLSSGAQFSQRLIAEVACLGAILFSEWPGDILPRLKTP